MLHYKILHKLTQINWSILIVPILIATIGFFVLYSAAEGNLSPWTDRQMVRFGAGLIILIAFALIDLRFWLSQSYVLYLISLGMLFIVEIIGYIGKGGQRWIDLYVFHFQPSELMKVALLMALARYFHNSPLENTGQTKMLILPFLFISLPAILMMKQPDLGTATLLILAGFSIIFAAGIRIWKIMLFGGMALTAMPFLWKHLHQYQQERILTFLNPGRDPLGAGYHILQSNIALGSGGFWGKGFQAGSQAHLDFLPEKQTDFIFAMFCEEFGVFGGTILIFLYIILIAYAFYVSLKSRSAYGRYLGIGLATLLFLYVFINIAMVMGLVPVVGVPLPLVSYGGTSMLTFMMALGLLMSISIHRDIRVGRIEGLI
ncbi:MAG: rod shape-determining protein RodA [Caedibacter sp. 38-128]|nr:rod shape-determining protein RodA [Holosporales bacterium]OJX05744.1 MAG: rod shape-determining protein RodA [Caedibacter sp. 38-128]